ncbi:MAG: RNA polymerase sigma factor [bacterium]|nr:RNA polymerase sigma factor [bacterium]
MVEQNDTFIKAYDDFSDAIFRHCYFRVGNRELARDLMQETFTRTWTHISAEKPLQNIRAFLYRVATNLIIDESRKKKTSSLDGLREQGFDPGEDTREKLTASVDAKIVLRVLETLSPEYRAVVTMRYVDDFSPKEIAEVLGESENAVSVRLHRAIQKLREQSNEPTHTTLL